MSLLPGRGRIGTLLWALFFGLAAAAPCTGAEPGRIDVQVVNDKRSAVWLAQATIYGPEVRIAVTTQDGSLSFPSVLPGTYRIRVVRYGYETADITEVRLEPGQSLALTIRLAKTGLHEIASVTARTRPQAPASILRSDAEATLLSDSLARSLSSLPGVADTPSGALSVEGQPASQTTVAINGVPVSLPGSARSLALFDADVFSSASVTPSGGGGGVVDFQTRSPSLAWQGVARAVLASHDGEDVALQESGTAGQVGISYSHARNVVSDPLDGRSFLDASGIFYAHDASPAVSGDALQLRYEFSPANTILLTGVELGSHVPLVCRSFTGLLPCGYGPTNFEQTDLRSVQLRDSAQVGSVPFDLTIYRNDWVDDLDQSGFYVDGVAEPSSSSIAARQRGLALHASIPFGTSEIPVTFSSSATVSNGRGGAIGTFLPAFVSSYGSMEATARVPLLRTKRFTASTRLSYMGDVNGTARSSRITSDLALGYALSRNDSLYATFAPAQLGGPTARFYGVSPADELQFVCDGRTGLGVGPSVTSGPSDQTDVGFGWSHNGTHWSSQIALHHDVQLGAPVDATVSALELDPALFGNDYLDQARQNVQRACGTGPTVGLGDLYFDVAGTAERAVYDGGHISVGADLGDRTKVRGSVTITSARAYGADPILFGPHSTVVSGRQLPGVPRESADLSISSLVSAHLTGLVRAQFQAANNGSNLPAHITFDAGLLLEAPRGLLSVTMTNIGNAYPGPFATAAGALPLPMLSGEFPTIARPLAPRTLRIGYRFHVGLPERQVTFAIPTEQFQRPRLGFASTVTMVPLESSPSAPFSINRQSVNCGPKDVAPASAILAEWQHYVAGIGASTSDGAYPADYPPLVDDAVRFDYRRFGDAYVVTTSAMPGRDADYVRQMQPLLSCATIHSAQQADVERRGLFEHPIGERNVALYAPIFSPHVGLYVAPITFRDPDVTTARRLPVPSNMAGPPAKDTAPPGAPFTLRPCSPELEPAARQFLETLKSYVAAYYAGDRKPETPEGFMIAAHAGRSGQTWLEIRTEDLGALAPLSRCMYVRDIALMDLEKLGIGGQPAPELDYAPSIGLYRAF